MADNKDLAKVISAINRTDGVSVREMKGKTKIKIFNFFSCRQISMKICMQCYFHAWIYIFAVSRLLRILFRVFCHRDTEKVPKSARVPKVPVVW